MTKHKIARKAKPSPLPLILICILIALLVIGFLKSRFTPIPQPIEINQVDNSTGAITLALSPATLNIHPGEESTLNLTTNAGDLKVTYIKVELNYDTSKLELPVVTKGDFLSNSVSGPTVEGGKIKFEFSSSPGGKTGSGTLAILKIKPKVVGSSTLSFTNTTSATALDAAGNYLPGNQLKTATDATVNTTAQEDNPTKPGKPTGLRSNCYDYGNKITFRWDAVSGATSYKLRLDQKNGSGDKSIDNIANTEYNLDIIPNQDYAWWVHTTKNGLDSEEAKIELVRCNKQSTPTPTPTPTPTRTPTPSLTPKSSSTPTSTPSYSPSSTNNLNWNEYQFGESADTTPIIEKKNFFESIYDFLVKIFALIF